LVRTALRNGVRIETEREVTDIAFTESSKYKFTISCKDGTSYESARLIIATGGLSYPGTGSTGDGYKWAEEAGHKIKPLFPSLTAIVPKGYKTIPENMIGKTDIKGHIDRSCPLSETGEYLCGIHLKNVTLTVYTDGNEIQNEFGDIDFTDGGIEGPIGFEVSRNCVKTIMNGGKINISIDMKPAVGIKVLTERISAFWKEISNDSRSTRLNFKEKYRILLGKLIPWELITGFIKCNSMPVSKSGNKIKDLNAAGVSELAAALKGWKFDIEGFVGYERSVVTAGGISSDGIVAKTMESKFRKGLYFCGEILDMDSDTGGYNLQTAFSTGYLAGISAAKNIAKD
jgi:predicted flavoprotein YhiN